MIYNQCKIFFIFFILGIFTGILFDFFRTLRKTFKTSNIIIYIEDILFFIITGAVFLNSILVFAYGEIRFYIFIAIILGIVIYVLTLSNLCAIIFKVILDFLKKFILCFIRMLKIPLKIINIALLKIKMILRISHNKFKIKK